MAKEDNIALFQLIHSMSKAEKRQFKLKSSSGLKYIQLFDLLNQQKEYDKDYILKRTNYSADKYAKMKNFLYQHIIYFLTSQKKAVSKNEKIENLFHESQVLSDRKFYQFALKRIKKGIELCQKYEIHDLLIKFCHLKRMVVLNTNDKDVARQLEGINSTINYSIREIDNYYQLQRIGDELNILLIKKGHLNKEKTSQYVSELMNEEILLNEENAISHRSKQLYNFIHGAYQLIIINNTEKAAVYSKRRIELWKEHMELVEINPVNYMNSLNNYIFFTFKLNLLEEAKTCIADLNSIRENYFHLLNKGTQSKLLEYILTNELLYFKVTLNKSSSFSTLSQIEQFATNHYRTMNNYAALVYYYIGLSHYYLYNLKQSQNSIHQIINARQFRTLREDVQVSALFIQLIILFELKKFELLSYRISTFKYHIKDKIENYPVLNLFVNYLDREINALLDAGKSKELLKELKAALQSITPKTDTEILQFDIIDWVDSKIQ